MRAEVKSILESPIIAVIRNFNESEALYVIEALLSGGVRNIELTFGDVDPTKLIQEANSQFKEDIMIGAGTVMTSEQVKSATNAGAKFIFSPNFNEKVVKETLAQNVVSIPGCFSPTEIYNAYSMGADFVKIFPANTLGDGFIKDIKAPMPYLNIIPTGGVNKENMKSFLKAGASAVGLGNSLLDKQLIERKDYKALADHAKEFVSIANSVNKE